MSGITDQNERLTPNPNVMYELGLADSRLPTERVLLLFDGDQNQLPVDIRQRRTSNADGELTELLRRSAAVHL